jgi:hypothetical protein
MLMFGYISDRAAAPVRFMFASLKCRTPVHKFSFLWDWLVVACVSWKATPETLDAASPWIERFQTTRVLVMHVRNKHPLLPERRLLFFSSHVLQMEP